MFIIALFCVQPAAGAGVIYDGDLSSKYDEIDGTGSWLGGTWFWHDDDDGHCDQEHPVTMTWAVSRNADMSWRYEYELSVDGTDISHIIIEASENFTSEDIFNCSEYYEVKWYSPGNSDPNMPGDVYGIKFDDLSGGTERIIFDSWRAPVWGDFYAKGGKKCGSASAAWNTGFTDPDPDVVPSSGSQYSHILVPDTVTEPIPEPATVTLLGLGIGLAYIRRRRRS